MGGHSCSGPKRRALHLLVATMLASFAVGMAHAATFLTPSVDQFERAQALRSTLEAQPATLRTWGDYENVLNAYRAVYHQDPQSPKADASIVAVAELLAEKGRVFHKTKPLQEAIGQYEFLRKQYPSSPCRFSALMSEGLIYLNDLHDDGQAEAKFEQFLENYPDQPLAAEARSKLQQIHGDENAAKTALIPPSPQAKTAAMPSAHGPGPVQSPPLAKQAAPAGNVKAAASLGSTDATAPKNLTTVSRIRYWSTARDTRIAINLGGQVPYKFAHLSNPDRIYYDLEGTSLNRNLDGRDMTVAGSSFLQQIRAAQFSRIATRIVLNVGPSTESSAFYLSNPWRLIISLHAGKPQPLKDAETTPKPIPARTVKAVKIVKAAAAEPEPAEKPAVPPPPARSITQSSARNMPLFTARRADPTSNGEHSLVRTLGLKINRIVIDPGHGGYDPGALGPGGIEEKNVVLDVALRLGKLLQDQLGEDVIYTRTTDKFVPLEKRTAIANQAHADLFISIHANSSSDKAVRGVESYYLNFTTDPGALAVAARENAVSNEPIYDLSNLIKKIALDDKVEESREFAIDVQKSLYDGLRKDNPGLKNRGVKQAPFVVLIGARMPSILVEISFLTNPMSAHDLREADYQERIAESLYRGIAEYIRGLSGIRLAQYPETSNPALQPALHP